MLLPLDLAVFAGYMVLLFGIGIWFTKQQKDLKSYLLADQNIHWIIVAVSVLAALFSGITYLAAPSQTFFQDLGILWVVVSFFIATPITTIVFLPFFRGLNLFTAYEYLERRFDRRLRYVASGLFLCRVSIYVATVIFAPALAIQEITGLAFWQSVLITGGTATVYTALGGMKAVIWTDSIQFLVLCGGIVLIVVFAARAVPGGIAGAWEAAAQDGKTKLFHFGLDPAQFTIWAGLLGGTCSNLVQMVTDQISVQRYLTATSLKAAQRALWFKLAVTLPLVGAFYLTGTVLYGFYKTHPNNVPTFPATVQGSVPDLAQPGTTPTLQRRDRILPYFVVHELPSPLPGLLIAALFGATMAVVSAGVNSLATATLMDFVGELIGPGTSDAGRVALARRLTIGFGVFTTLLALGVEVFGETLIDISFTTLGLFGGPLLGMFFLGVLSRRANGSGALLGAAAGAAVGVCVGFAKPLFGVAIASPWIAFSTTTVTFLTGLIASLAFRAPGLKQQAFVFRRGMVVKG